MTRTLRTSLLITMLLAQLLGVVSVLCIEEGGVALEFQAEECCADEGDAGMRPSEDPGSCGTCQDMSLAQLRSEQERDDMGRALASLSVMAPIEFPLEVSLARLDLGGKVLPDKPPAEAVGVVALVAATIVLTC